MENSRSIELLSKAGQLVWQKGDVNEREMGRGDGIEEPSRVSLRLSVSLRTLFAQFPSETFRRERRAGSDVEWMAKKA
jgi:hypothetical protein